MIFSLVLIILFFYNKNAQVQKKLNELQILHQEQINELILSHANNIHELKVDFEKEKKNATKLSLSASRNTIKGQISEKFCPFQENFPYTPHDCTFLGKPIDFIVFHNIEKYRDNEDGVSIDDIEIIFLEIKTGKSSLTKVEKAIKHAILNKRIRFETYRYDGIAQPDISLTTISKSHIESNLHIVNGDENLAITPLNFNENDLICRTESQSNIVLKTREKYARSNYKWSENETDLLIQKYDEGYNLTELSILFQRTPTGLSSRLEKLGVEVQVDE